MNPAPLSYSAELQRKALHLAALVIPLGLLLLGRQTALWILVPLAAVAVTLDVARQRITRLNDLIERFFSFMMRPEERPEVGSRIVLNGATWMCIAATVCAFFFVENIAAAGLAMLMVGDGAAAIVGRRFGRHKLANSEKSFEGSIAFVFFAVLVCLPLMSSAWGYPPLTLAQIGLGAVSAAVIEALPIPINDNLRVPLVASLAIALL